MHETRKRERKEIYYVHVYDHARPHDAIYRYRCHRCVAAYESYTHVQTERTELSPELHAESARKIGERFE